MTEEAARPGVPRPKEGDVVVRAECARRGVVVFAAEVGRTAREAEWRHLAGRAAAEALGRLMAAAALAGGFLRGDERQTMQIKTAGSLKGALVEIDASGNVRGYTESKVLPLIDLGPTDPAYAIGSAGTLTVIRSTASEVRAQGTVELARGDVATDVRRYLESSEQRPSIVALATAYDEYVRRASGVLLQAGPDADLEWFEARRADHASLEAALAEDGEPEERIARLLAGEEHAVVERRPLRFRCRCTRERVVAMIGGLDVAELKDMLEKDRGATVTCHFCNDEFTLDAATLEGLIRRREGR